MWQQKHIVAPLWFSSLAVSDMSRALLNGGGALATELACQ